MATKAELKARLSLDTALFERGISLAHAGANRLGTTFTGLGSVGVAAWAKLAGGLAALGGAAGFVKAAHGAFELGSSLKEMSDRTGIAVKNLVVLQQAFREAGLEAEEIGTMVNRMQRFIEQAGPQKLGQAFFVLRQMKPEDQFQLLARVINALPTAMQRAAAAQEAFGRGGGKLLQVFAELDKQGGIRDALQRQADLLDKNAEKFDEVADHIKRIGTQLRGFFVGVAAGIVDYIKPVIDRLGQMDFSAMGQKFGAALVTGAEALVGFFKNPEWLYYGLTEGFKAALMEAGNILIAVFRAGIEFFREGLVSMFVGLGDVIIGVLTAAFAKPIAYLQAGIEAAAARAPGALENETRQAKEQYATLTKMLTVIDKARDDWFRISQEDPFSEQGERARKKFQELQEEHEKLMKQREAIEPATRGILPTVEERFQRIMAQGGPMVGIFEIKTAQQYIDEGAKNLSNAFDAAAKAVRNIKVEDVMGAGQALANAMAAARVAVQQGQAFFQQVPGMLGQRRMAGPGESQAIIDEMEANRVRFAEQLAGTPLSERHFRTPIEEARVAQDKAIEDYYKGVAQAAAEWGTPANAERMMASLKARFEEQLWVGVPGMMRDIYRPGAIMGAFGVQGALGLGGGPQEVVSERHARREAWLRDRADKGAKDSVARSNVFLQNIQENTLKTAQAWE